MELKKLVKGSLKIFGGATIEGALGGVVASIVPLTMINPVVGGIVVAGTTLVSLAVSDRLVDGYIDEKVDQASDKMKEKKEEFKNMKESIELINKAKEICKKDGLDKAKEFLKKEGFDDAQIAEQTKNW